jgi:hydroxymethylglutaryl-CoA synthase
MTIPFKSESNMPICDQGEFGILALQVYFPQWYVDQSELEIHDNVSSGKYTVGLGQCTMAFCHPDEDVVSMAKSVVEKLLFDYGIDAEAIGRIEVGSESNPDKSKSIKSHIVGMYPEAWKGCGGSDCIGACFGGTAALLNSLNWLESSEWNGKYALVVMSDIAAYEKWSPARPTGGAGAIALLLGPGAPILIDRRTIYHCEDTVDFYKPSPEEFPIVDGRQSIECYLRALRECFSRYHSRGGDSYRKLIMHCPFAKIVQKAGKLLTELDDTLNFGDSLNFGELAKESLLLCKYLGNLYAASVYGALASLICCGSFEEGEENNILVFSYGSGLLSCMFQMRLVDLQKLKVFKEKLNLQERLQMRTKCTVEEFDARESTFGKRNLIIGSNPSLEPRFYLKRIDSEYVRYYAHD